MATRPGRGRADYFAPGDWNAVCAFCGRKGKASEMVKLPAGDPLGGNQYVHPEHWRPRQMQDFVRGVPENIAPPWTQPAADGATFLSYNVTSSDLTGGTYVLTVSTSDSNSLNSGINNLNVTEGTLPTGAGSTVIITIPEGLSVTTLDLSGTPATVTKIIINNYGYVGTIAGTPVGVTVTRSGAGLYGGVFTLTAAEYIDATSPPTRFVGFSQGAGTPTQAFGVISPPTFNGITVRDVWIDDNTETPGTDPATGFAIELNSGPLAQDYFTAVTINNILLLSATASFTSGAGLSVWFWSMNYPINAAGVYTVTFS